MAISDSLVEISALDSGVTCVRLNGEIDIVVELHLRASLDELIREGHNRLLVDLSDVTFIDSAGLGVLLDTAKQLRRGRFAVACPNKSMRGMFELVGLNLLFSVDESVDEALHHLTPRRRFTRR
jgi:anti-sigma B factor antagonist